MHQCFACLASACGRTSRQSFSSRDQLLLFCRRHRCVGHVSWSADTSRRRHACLIDRCACLVEPRTCDWHTKCSRLTVRSRFPSLAPSWGPLTYSEDLDSLLDDLFLSSRFQLGRSWIGLHTGVNSCCSVCCSQDSSV